ncbi:hypothetical protein CSC12_3365 [Klebsiella michiganensis]|nr:hypothetical protein CSC12_3365 [Klebsiella michiganensis]
MKCAIGLISLSFSFCLGQQVQDISYRPGFSRVIHRTGT